MGAVDVCLMLLVWTLTAVCKDYDMTCDDVTGHVGDDLTLTCRVSYEDNTCCMMMYKLMNKDKDTEIYREGFRSDPCIQLTSFPYPYTNEVTTTKIKFFSQTTCGAKTTEFTVNITDAVKEDDQGGSNRIEAEPEPEKKAPVQAGDRSVLAVIISVLSCFIIIVMGFVLRKKRTSHTSQFQRGQVCACELADVPPV